MIYYRFTLKRSTFDLFSFIGAGNDTRRLLPTFIKEYWYMFFVFGGMIWLMAWAYKKIKAKEDKGSYSLKDHMIQTLVFLFGTGLAVLGFRGGFQLIPITIVSAAQYTSVKNIPIVLNTPFTIMKSYDQDQLEEKKFLPQSELSKYINPIHPADTGGFRKMNVMVIMMESFSKEYIGALSGRRTCTPFLDSLIRHSVVFDNAYSNGKKSIEGIPAITAGIPALMNEAFITSPYGTNSINSLASLLKKKGYNSTFYHGATNGSMSFTDFCSTAGFDKYFGRTEYGNENDYDGNWGIWDEEFFLRVGDEMNKQPQPFLSALFTLTSHHPFPVPDKYKTRFPDDGILPIHKSISYTDYSLEKFFNKISKMPWFSNTLFVLTADHTGPSADPFYSNRVGLFQVPVIFYMPGNPAFTGVNHEVVQHIDIMPMILHLLHYDEPYFAMGHTHEVLPGPSDSTSNAINYISNIYAITTHGWQLQFDGEKTIGLFNFSQDSVLKNNKMNDPQDKALREELEKKLEAFIQQYNYSLIHNQMNAR
ncbi:MAG TPA: LTA synthase family protein [Bacteroidia bacterium]